MRRTTLLPVAILAVVCSGIAGVVLFRVAAEPKLHSVYLKWNPPPPVPGVTIASYNVYRTTKSVGTYDKIASGVSIPNYTDRNVRGGKTYYYYVRAVDAAGRESGPSNTVSAAIP